MDSKSFICNECGKSFTQQANLTDHENIHYGHRPFHCKQCNKCYNNRGAFYNHMRIHNDDRFYVCPLCKANFMWDLSMKTHLNSHQRNGELTAQMAAEIYEKSKMDVRLKKLQLKNAARKIIEVYVGNPTKKTEVPSMKATEASNYENLENWMCEASSSRTSTYANETSSHLLNKTTANSGINENPTPQFQDINQTRNLYQHQFPCGSDQEEEYLLIYDPYKSMHSSFNYIQTENTYPSANNSSHQSNCSDYPSTSSFYEQPSASFYSNEEYSPNFQRIYEKNMENNIHQISPNMTTEQQFIPEQPFHYTFGEQYNLQNANAHGNINDHAFNANYAYYQPHETFGNPNHQNNQQAAYANETFHPLWNIVQPQISYNQDFEYDNGYLRQLNGSEITAVIQA
ncbi:Zinc finger protein with KRAB and SCAN domains 5 [Trichinella murrelli]|uniref:Zinc finger protein with KRAB and SCAN domains 5 n=1 Tax=Trichinella murrelli TaxID=144512 RepID=A0A0V0TWU5_9BILA|nr:Zinc finger protein with KRAB and SCAN domains 5 [Trichinella murrelli]